MSTRSSRHTARVGWRQRPGAMQPRYAVPPLQLSSYPDSGPASGRLSPDSAALSGLHPSAALICTVHCTHSCTEPIKSKVPEARDIENAHSTTPLMWPCLIHIESAVAVSRPTTWSYRHSAGVLKRIVFARTARWPQLPLQGFDKTH